MVIPEGQGTSAEEGLGNGEQGTERRESLWLAQRHPSCLPLEEEGPGVEVSSLAPC